MLHFLHNPNRFALLDILPYHTSWPLPHENNTHLPFELIYHILPTTLLVFTLLGGDVVRLRTCTQFSLLGHRCSPNHLTTKCLCTMPHTQSTLLCLLATSFKNASFTLLCCPMSNTHTSLNNICCASLLYTLPCTCYLLLPLFLGDRSP